MADRPDRTATQFPTVTGNRPDRNKDEGGGIALLLLGGGLLGWGIYEATKQKCPSGYTLVNGLCVAPSSSSSSESSNSSSSSASPPPSSSSSGPVGVCATELGTVLTALPFYWSSLSAIGQLVNTEFAMLLNRWPCGEGYTSFNWTDVYNAPCCGYTPIQMVAMRIVTDQAGEFLQDVQALANTYLAGGAFAGNPNRRRTVSSPPPSTECSTGLSAARQSRSWTLGDRSTRRISPIRAVSLCLGQCICSGNSSCNLSSPIGSPTTSAIRSGAPRASPAAAATPKLPGGQSETLVPLTS